MAGMTVDGLVSGLDTATIISQLMQLEAQPQQNLRNKVTTEQTVLAAYQNINTRMAALSTAATTLSKDDAWNTIKVNSSSSAVTASATTSSSTGSVTFDIDALAVAHSIRSNPLTSLTDAVSTSAGLDFTINGGTPVHVATADTSLSGVVSAVNSQSSLGITAAAVKVADGSYRLQLSSKATGSSASFTVSGLSVATAVATTGTNAQITIGEGAGAYTVESSTNTFTDVLPGVTFSVNKMEDEVTLTTSPDSQGIADKVQKMVDAVNSTLSEIKSSTSYNADTKKAAPLLSDFAVRQMQSTILSTVSNTIPGHSLKEIGIELDKTGKLTFDQSVFIDKFGSDPSTTKSLLSSAKDTTSPGGLATQFISITKTATDFSTGTLTKLINGGNEKIRELNGHIADWDTRLVAKKVALQKQFTGLEVALSKLKSQSTWLSGQLSSLSSSSG